MRYPSDIDPIVAVCVCVCVNAMKSICGSSEPISRIDAIRLQLLDHNNDVSSRLHIVVLLTMRAFRTDPPTDFRAIR